MHPLTVYEIAVRDHERATAERHLEAVVRRRRRALTVPTGRAASRRTASPAPDGRPATA